MTNTGVWVVSGIVALILGFVWSATRKAEFTVLDDWDTDDRRRRMITADRAQRERLGA